MKKNKFSKTKIINISLIVFDALLIIGLLYLAGVFLMAGVFAKYFEFADLNIPKEQVYVEFLIYSNNIVSVFMFEFFFLAGASSLYYLFFVVVILINLFSKKLEFLKHIIYFVLSLMFLFNFINQILINHYSLSSILYLLISLVIAYPIVIFTYKLTKMEDVKSYLKKKMISLTVFGSIFLVLSYTSYLFCVIYFKSVSLNDDSLVLNYLASDYISFSNIFKNWSINPGFAIRISIIASLITTGIFLIILSKNKSEKKYKLN